MSSLQERPKQKVSISIEGSKITADIFTTTKRYPLTGLVVLERRNIGFKREERKRRRREEKEKKVTRAGIEPTGPSGLSD